jgi:uncharacterized membrane protein YidH (DUF202 family)
MTITEKQKSIIIAVGVLTAALGFSNIAGLIDQLPKDLDVIITAISSLISVVTAYYKKVEDTVKE